MPLAVFIAGSISVIIATELNGKSGKSNPPLFLGIAPGFFDFTNEARLHSAYLLKLKSTALYYAVLLCALVKGATIKTLIDNHIAPHHVFILLLFGGNVQRFFHRICLERGSFCPCLLVLDVAVQ